MLLSQKIAKRIDFLNSHHNAIHREKLYDIRMKVVKSIKMIVGLEVFNSDIGPREFAQKYLGGEGIKDTAKRLNMYKLYAMPPFNLLFIENESGGVLIEKMSDDGDWSGTYIASNGMVAVVKPIYRRTKTLLDQQAMDIDFLVDPSRVPMEEEDVMFMQLTLYAYAEALLFLNVPNVRIHQYKPSRKENAMVPKSLLPWYEYKVLDVFREKEQYSSMKEIEDFAKEASKEKMERRMHIVRGHFKELRKGRPDARLVWWSAFTRCRKNLETVGIIDKDYHLH